MTHISDKKQSRRLKNFNIDIKTTYKDDNKILQRNTNNQINDDIANGVILTKEYYKDNISIKKVSGFDPRIEYSFISNDDINKEMSCPNCGYIDIPKNQDDGCPHCKTNYNMEYVDKKLGAKYHYDRAIHGNKYILITLIIDFIVSALLVFLYVTSTNRTFNIYDISKIVLGTFVLSALLFYIFYMLDGIIITLPVRLYKDKMNRMQKCFWKKMDSLGVNRKTFYNNFNYELQSYYYEQEENFNVIDYDIIDYISFNDYKDNSHLKVDVKVIIRVVRVIDGKLVIKEEKQTFTLIRNDIPYDKIKSGINIISCHNCGASIDVTSCECEFCKTKNNYLQEWYLV